MEEKYTQEPSREKQYEDAHGFIDDVFDKNTSTTNKIYRLAWRGFNAVEIGRILKINEKRVREIVMSPTEEWTPPKHFTDLRNTYEKTIAEIGLALGIQKTKIADYLGIARTHIYKVIERGEFYRTTDIKIAGNLKHWVESVGGDHIKAQPITLWAENDELTRFNVTAEEGSFSVSRRELEGVVILTKDVWRELYKDRLDE